MLWNRLKKKSLSAKWSSQGNKTSLYSIIKPMDGMLDYHLANIHAYFLPQEEHVLLSN